MTDPIAEYAHYGSGGNAVIIVAGTYRNQPGGAYNFGSEYEGDLFIADFRKAWLRRYKWDGTSWNIAAPVPGQPTATEWATGLNRITDGVVGPDGDLYYTNRQQDLVGRIRRGAGPANEIALMAEQSMAGATVTLQNANLVTGSEYFNLFSLEPCSPGVGHGPYLGLCTSAPTLLLNQFYTPVGTNPSHFIATSPTMTWGPYAILPMMVDGVTFEWTDGGIGQVSSVTRFLVQ